MKIACVLLNRDLNEKSLILIKLSIYRKSCLEKSSNHQSHIPMFISLQKKLRCFLPTPFPHIFYRTKNAGASNWWSCLTSNFISSISPLETKGFKWSYPLKQHLPHCKLYTKSSSYCSWITRSVDLCSRNKTDCIERSLAQPDPGLRAVG